MFNFATRLLIRIKSNFINFIFINSFLCQI